MERRQRMTSPRRRPAGFTLYELIVAIVLLGLAVHPLLSALAADTQTATDRQGRLNAARALANEAALLAASDPDQIPAVRTYRVGPSGQTSANGDYVVLTIKTVRCGVGGSIPDAPTAPLPLGCAVGGAVADYEITVTFPRSAGGQEVGTATTRVSVPASAVHPATTGGTP
jgi:prepilin-type N-terminal cleavage/methylation domain-containing protein